MKTWPKIALISSRTASRGLALKGLKEQDPGCCFQPEVLANNKEAHPIEKNKQKTSIASLLNQPVAITPFPVKCFEVTKLAKLGLSCSLDDSWRLTLMRNCWWSLCQCSSESMSSSPLTCVRACVWYVNYTEQWQRKRSKGSFTSLRKSADALSLPATTEHITSWKSPVWTATLKRRMDG